MDFESKVQVLKDQFFPPPPIADLDDIAMSQYPTLLQSSKTITLEEVYAAIQKPNPDKALSFNRLPNWLFKMVLEVFLPHFMHLFQACINLGYHPEEFQIANTIVLKKPKKSNYTLTESYQPIALLNILGKALEAILVRHLSELAETRNFLPPQQMINLRKWH